MTQVLPSLQLGPWTGGARFDVPVEEVGANEIYDGRNYRVGPAGEIFPRPGTDSYGDAAAIGGAPTVTMAYEFVKDASTTYVVMAAGAVLYKWNSGWSSITGATTLTAGDDNTWEIINANGTFVMTNGVDTDAIKWTGSGDATALDDDGRFSKGRHIAWFDNRLWIGNVNGATGKLWYSDTADIETWGATSFFNIDGIIVGLVPMQNALSVHTTTGIYTFTPTGDASLPYRANRRTSGTGAGIDGRSILSLPDDTQLFVRKDGIYKWDGGSEIGKISGKLNGERFWQRVNKDRLHKAFAVLIPSVDQDEENVAAFCLPVGVGQTNMNYVVYFDYVRNIWWGPDIFSAGRNCAAVIGGKFHMGGFDGILYDHEDGSFSDDGVSVPVVVETGAPAPYGPDVQLGWVRARHFYDGQGSSLPTMQVSQKSAMLDGTTEEMSLEGIGFDLDGTDTMDGTVQLGGPGQLSQETPLQGYAPQVSIELTQNQAGFQFKHRKILLQYEMLGKPSKAKPTD